MATVVWIGSPDGPDEVEFMGTRFPKGKSIEVEDKVVLAKAAGNHFFEVEGYEVTAPEAPLTYRPPSEQSAQGPVPKAGEPIVSPKGPEPGPAPPEGGGGETPVVASEGHHPAVRAAMQAPKRGR